MLTRQFTQYILGLVFLVSSGFVLSHTEFWYRDYDDGILLLNCISGDCSDIVFPETYDGKTVKGISNSSPGMFQSTWYPESNNITSVTIPPSLYFATAILNNPNVDTTFYFLGDRDKLTYWMFGDEQGIASIYYCPGRDGWPGEDYYGITPQPDLTCDSDDDGVVNTEDAFPFDSSRHHSEDQYATFDIDQSGSVDALSDGLILLRYFFGLRGDSLISGVISPDANRTSAADIEAYIESHMP